MENKKKEKQKRKLSLNYVFRNNKLLLLISFLLACIIWLMFVQVDTEDMDTTIYDVPVTVELSEQAKEEGFKVYEGTQQGVTVRIRGNRMAIGSVTKDDIQVVARDTIGIMETTNKTVEIVAKKNPNSLKDFEILSPTSSNPESIYIFVDKERTDEFSLKNNKLVSDIDISELSRPSGNYHMWEPVLSTTTVVVTGPQSEVKRIDTVQVSDKLSGEYNESISLSKEPTLLDSDGEEISQKYLTVSPETVDVTIRISPTKTVPVNMNFTKDTPKGIDIDNIATVTPKEITIAGSQETLDGIDSVDLETAINFTYFTPGVLEESEYNINLPDGISIVDGATDAKATVKMDFSAYTTKNFDIADLKHTALSGYDVTVSTSGLRIQVSGKATTLEELTAEDIVVTADLTNLGDNPEGSREVPVNIRFSGADDCWVYNNAKEYTVTVYIEASSTA